MSLDVPATSAAPGIVAAVCPLRSMGWLPTDATDPCTWVAAEHPGPRSRDLCLATYCGHDRPHDPAERAGNTHPQETQPPWHRT